MKFVIPQINVLHRGIIIMSNRDYRSDLAIDPNSLDLEWTHQPQLFMEYAEMLAVAEKHVRSMEENVKRVRSDLVKRILLNPGKYLGVDVKISDPKIEACYRTHSEHVDAKEKLSDAMYDESILRNAVSALRQRKDALQELVRLAGQEYFAGPTVPRELDPDMIDKWTRSRAGDKVGKGLNAKRKRKNGHRA